MVSFYQYFSCLSICLLSAIKMTVGNPIRHLPKLYYSLYPPICLFLSSAVPSSFKFAPLNTALFPNFFNFKKPRSARHFKAFQCRTYRQTYRLCRPALICNYRIHTHRIKVSFPAFQRGIEGF